MTVRTRSRCRISVGPDVTRTSESERTGRIIPDGATTGRLSICWVRTFGGPVRTKSSRFPPTVISATRNPSLKMSTALPEFAHADAAVREAGAVRRDSYLRGAELQPRPRSDLGPAGAWQRLEELPHGPAGDAQDCLEVGTLDVEIDPLAAADGAPEQGRLGHEPEGPGLAEHRAGQDGDELAGPLRLRAGRTDEGLRRGRDEEEVLDSRRWPPGGARPGAESRRRRHGRDSAVPRALRSRPAGTHRTLREPIPPPLRSFGRRRRPNCRPPARGRRSPPPPDPASRSRTSGPRSRRPARSRWWSRGCSPVGAG